MKHRASSKLNRFYARRLERAINAALAEHGFPGQVRVYARHCRFKNRQRFPVQLARITRAIAGRMDCSEFDFARAIVNARLVKAEGGLPELGAEVNCPRCGKRLQLEAEPQEWTRYREGRLWKVTGLWPPIGDCCGLIFCDDPFSGIQVYSMATKSEVAS